MRSILDHKSALHPHTTIQRGQNYCSGPEIAPQGFFFFFFPQFLSGFPHNKKVLAEMRACGWLQLSYWSAAWGSCFSAYSC